MSNTLDGMDAAGTLNRVAMANLAGSCQSSQALARRRAAGFAEVLANTADAGTSTDVSASAAARQTSVVGQVSATVTTPAVALPAATLPAATSPFAAAALAGAQERALAATQQPAAQQPAAAAGSQTQVTNESIAAEMSHYYAPDAADDAYWAKQPAAVQQLREIDDPDQRKAQATQLAGEGYTIDVPIMVWGFDAGKTTALRQQYGYTWVPSALQNPVELAPGLTMPTMASYDPNHPPAGSIIV
jgi:hypothetical protein